MKKILVLGGYDPSGGAGLAADLRAARAVGVAAFPIATCLAMQTDSHFIALKPIPNAEIDAQIMTLGHHPFGAIKIGALGFLAGWQERFALLKKFSCPIVLDPVLQSTSGGWLCEPQGREAAALFLSEIFPHVDLITPNIPEARFLLSGLAGEGNGNADLAKQLFQITQKAILLKGGHADHSDLVTDFFASQLGIEEISQKRIPGKNMRGTGCFLATAIAGFLTQGNSPLQSCRAAAAHLLSHRGIK